MTLKPLNRQDLVEVVSRQALAKTRIQEVDLGALNRIISHVPEDMTAQVETGLSLGEFQRALAGRGQWLPVDPAQPDSLSIARLLAENRSGPRRFGHGTVRDHLIGLQVLMADGRFASSGGNVVKNVAGYDVMKLHLGAHFSLGIPVVASFKLLPLPEAEVFLQRACSSFEEAEAVTEAVLASPLMPVVLDWHRVCPLEFGTALGCQATLGLAGTKEEVEWQSARASELGWTQRSHLDYETDFFAEPSEAIHSVSLLPSRLKAVLGELRPTAFVARAGNGIIHYVGAPAPVRTQSSGQLQQALKDAFDPHHLFPDLPS